MTLFLRLSTTLKKLALKLATLSQMLANATMRNCSKLEIIDIRENDDNLDAEVEVPEG